MNNKISHDSVLRIIGGDWRGRKLPVIDSPGLRPTGNRIRETLFNWLQGHIVGRRCLDLFAGSGALSFEALSRGASEVHMVESASRVARQLQANLTTLDCRSAEVHRADALQWLKTDKGLHQHFDLIFLDPPFAKKLWCPTLEALSKSAILKSDTLIYIEHPRAVDLHFPGLTTRREKVSGEVRYGLYQLGHEAISDRQTVIINSERP